MRVIAGSAKGVRLGPVPAGVRPVSDRVREGLFSSLAADVPGAAVLDLFAGTGALGIEALSRGAERAVFVEGNRAATRAIRSNLERAGVADRADIVTGDVARFVMRDDERREVFDLVFADPPYEAPAARVDALLRELARGWLEPGGAAVLTRSNKSSTPVIPVHFLVAKRLEYGDTAVLIFRPTPGPEPREG
jgi:16S rRNA (guanine966-N2)-methyltransferase